MGLFAIYNTVAIGYMMMVLIQKIIQLPSAVSAVYSYVSTKGLEGIAIDSFFIYTDTLYQTEKWCQRMYTAHPISQELFDRFVYLMYFLHAEFQDYRVEPYHHSWTNISTIQYSSHDYIVPQYRISFFGFNDPQLYAILNTHLNDEYCMIYPENTTNQLVVNALYAKHTKKLICDTNWRPVLDACITMKYNGRYFSKVIRKKDELEQEIDLTAKRSRTSFLSIEYKHPALDEPILIELDKMYYTIGNDILSASFIRRYLEYQYRPSGHILNCIFCNGHLRGLFEQDDGNCILNKDYTVSIMDNQMKTFTLGMNQYVRLAERSYEIITLDAE